MSSDNLIPLTISTVIVQMCDGEEGISSSVHVIMAALHSRCGHYIFALWFLLSI